MKHLALVIALLMPVTAFAATDYEVTSLTQADIDFYLGIMRAAAAHNAHLTGDDKAAADQAIQWQKHPPSGLPSNPTPAQIQQMTHAAQLAARAAELASYDEKIAEQRGVTTRYDAIKDVVESVMVQISGMGGSCGGDCSPPGGFTKAQLDRAKQEEAAENADKPLIKPHVAEIASLKMQIGGFMSPIQ
ncbi:MAG TPA: hypothetical protein VHW02_15365 [Rhizomicrobium sp.]|jgi:hypothetical protein|nr:hypothetical protein [Rhizomicrobium sp.]